jgi:signal transduction histidine kinase
VDTKGRCVQIKTRRGESGDLPKDGGRLSKFSAHECDYALLGILNERIQARRSMLEEAQRLQDLVDSLLTLARAEADQQPLSRLLIELGALTRDVVESLRILADEKRQQFTAELDGEVPIAGDAALLRHALLNRVHNAISYTPGGRANHGPLLTARPRSRDRSLRHTGEGIAPDHQAKVFERFYRADMTRSRAEGGAGLGLAIAKLAIERHGGRIELESAVGKGSVFRVILPARP